MDKYNIIKLVLFSLGLFCLCVAGFIANIVIGFVTTGILLISVSVLLQKEIESIPQKKGR
ncbi:hypothetical protein HED42_07045 [Enterococcus casseliflavus]|uniref:hypothetical protein n=1 Tax=Enterococcus casseliflavus TaxID=37734 RepID=UPI001432DC25|nr:hypothetical protein [Enterococcus casseliflavus]NKD37887.1 hypothetical protein [Enterococcus casseliflavus]